MDRDKMKIIFWKMLTVFFIMAECASCKTEKLVYGKWRNGLDSIEFRNDYTFMFVSSHFDSTVHKRINNQYPGTWSFAKDRIYVNFEDSLNRNYFGGCKSVQVSKILFFRTKLMRSRSCAKDATPAMPLFYARVK